MSTVDPSQLPALVSDVGYDVMLEEYSREPSLIGEIFEVVPYTDTSVEGYTAKVISGVTEPEETERGQDAPARTLDEGWQWFLKVRKLQESMTIPEEMFDSPNANGLITQHILQHMGGLGGGFASKKEKMAAALFNRGSITAGDRNAFKGSYTGHTDPNEGLIYDGKPWFAPSGNRHPFKIASTATGLYNQDANALDAANLNSAYQLHVTTNAYNEANEYVGGNRPDTLLVPPALLKTASTLVNSTLLPGTAQNDANYLQGMFRVIPWWALTDTDGWFLGRARRGIRAYDSGIPKIITSVKDKLNGDSTVRLVGYFGAHVYQWRDWSAHATSTS